MLAKLTPKQKGKGTGSGLRSSYLRVCHLELSTGESVSTGAGSSLLGGQRWTAAEEEEFAEMARYRDAKGGIFERFARSVAPSIYGNEGKE
jgi:DNA replicative helicase MCM subunit Mcm2 (Cdc46/Mcm family)